MSAGETTSRRKLKAIEIEGLVRALPGEMVERALDRALEGLEGEAAAAVKALPRPVDPATIQVSALPDEALTAVGAILLDAACQAALKGDSEPRIQAVAPANEPAQALSFAAPPEAVPTEPVIDFDKTGAFTGKVWTPDTRQGSFRTFWDSSSQLSRAEFMERYKTPFLLSPVSVEPSTWTGTVVFPLSKKDDEDTTNQITLGRDDVNDVVAKHPSVSRRHGVFSLVEGRWFLTDLGSNNGTFVEGKRLPPNQPLKLPRDVVQIDFGDARLTLNTPENLFHFIEQIKKLQGAKAGAKPAPAPVPAVAPAPRPVALVLPTPKPPVPSPFQAAPKGTDTRRLQRPPAQGPGARKSRPVEKPTARLVAEKLDTVGLGSPKRIVIAIGAIVLAIAVAVWVYKPIVYLMFGESHPEWFAPSK